MKVIYLSAVDGRPFGYKGSAVRAEIHEGRMGVREWSHKFAGFGKDRAKLVAATTIVQEYVKKDDSVTIFFDSTRLACDYQLTFNGDWKGVRFRREWQALLKALLVCDTVPDIRAMGTLSRIVREDTQAVADSLFK